MSVDMRIHAFLPCSRANGPGMRAVIWTQGCSVGCPGCFNPATHPFEGGDLVSVRELAERIIALTERRTPCRRRRKEAVCGEANVHPVSTVPPNHESPDRGTGLQPVAESIRKPDGLQTRPTSQQSECGRGLSAPTAAANDVGFGRGAEAPPTFSAIEGVTVSGGEPLQQLPAVLALLRQLRAETALGVILFTGYEWAEVQAMPQSAALLACVDVLIAGRYVAGQRLARGLRGSANKTVHLLTPRYSPAELEAVPVAEVVISPRGEIALTGIEPVELNTAE